MRNPTVSCINISFNEHSVNSYYIPGTYVAVVGPIVRACIYCQSIQRAGGLARPGRRSSCSELCLETDISEHELQALLNSGKSTKLYKMDPLLQGLYAWLKDGVVFTGITNSIKNLGFRVEPEDQLYLSVTLDKLFHLSIHFFC